MSFEVYGYTTTCADIDYYVLSSPTGSSGTWAIEWSSTANTWSSSPDYNSSGPVDVAVVSGTFYAVGYGANCSSGLVFYWGDSELPTDGGFGDVTGYFGQSYPGHAAFDGFVTYFDELTGPEGMAVVYSTE